MATSGSVDWKLSAGDICTRAARLLGRLGGAQTLPGDVSATLLTIFNGYVKSLRSRGVMLHALFQDSFSLTNATPSYTLSPRVLSASNFRYRPSGGSDRILREITRSEYLDIPNKTSAGDPSMVYLDQQLGVSTLYVWQVQTTGSGALHFSAERILEDLDSISNDVDFDPEYQHPLVWNLAAEAAPEFTDVGSTRVQYIISHAAELEGDMLAASRPAFYSFLPDYD
jgi:hypothetical protein